MWPFGRRKARELEFELKRPLKPSRALVQAAGQPEPPHPTAYLRFPYEGKADLLFVASDNGELVRLWDWFHEGKYADLADEALLALERDRS